MTLCEAQLVQLVRDAVSQLRWQAVKPLSAQTWLEWVCTAIEIIDRCCNQVEPRDMIEGDL